METGVGGERARGGSEQGGEPAHPPYPTKLYPVIATDVTTSAPTPAHSCIHRVPTRRDHRLRNLRRAHGGPQLRPPRSPQAPRATGPNPVRRSAPKVITAAGSVRAARRAARSRRTGTSAWTAPLTSSARRTAGDGSPRPGRGSSTRDAAAPHTRSHLPSRRSPCPRSPPDHARSGRLTPPLDASGTAEADHSSSATRCSSLRVINYTANRHRIRSRSVLHHVP